MTEIKQGDMVIVANCSTVPEAQIYKGVLESSGIPCFVQGENHRNLLGDLFGAYIEVNLMVPVEFEDDAITILPNSADTLATNTEAAGDTGGGVFHQGESAQLSALIDDPALLPHLFIGEDHTLHTRLTVKDPDAYPATTQLSTDYIEVRVHYHHPEPPAPDAGPADGGSPDAGTPGQ